MKIKIYIINLVRSPHRRTYMAKQLLNIGIEYCFVDAVDGRGKTNVDFQSYNQNTINITGKDLKPTEVGAFLSHTHAIKQAKDDNVDWAIILEDDVVISPLFNDILNHIEKTDVDCIRMYTRGNNLATATTQIENRNTYKNWGGALGYAINQNGINKFLDVCDNFYMKIDNFLFGFWKHKLKIAQTDKNLVDIDKNIDSDIGYDRTDKVATKPLKRLIYKAKYNICKIFN